MRVLTKPFGEIELDERQRLRFPDGLYGFEELRDYALLDAAQPPFYWLQSLDRSEVAFILLDPRVFLRDYRLDVADDELEGIGVRDPADILDFAIVTVPEDPAEMTANLQGPIVINRRTRVGRQCISRNPDYTVRHRVLGSPADSRR